MTRRLIYLAAALFCMAGCITNDIPYPVVVPNITSLSADGAEKVEIDYDACKVTIYVSEDTDLRTINISEVAFDHTMVTSSISLTGVHDLTSPLRFKLSTYSDYSWTIAAVREVERYFTVQGQIGSSVIDPVNRRAVAMVGKKALLDNVSVTSLKLGPEGKTTYSLQLSQMKDFTDGIAVDVTAFDVTETWHLYVENTDVSVEIKPVNAWACEAYVTMIGVSGAAHGFQYRVKGAGEWTDVPESDVTVDGGTYTAHITGLNPETEYEVSAFCGADKAEAREFVTETATPLPNGSFEYASKVSGKDYYKFYDPDCGISEGMTMFWGSGNGEGPEGVNGSANMGIVITYVDTDEKVDGFQSVRAQTTQMAGILAAGNLFTGQFAGLVGTSGGKVNFGRPWTSRPKALKLYCKYLTGKMDIIKGMPTGVTLSKEDYDRADIKIALGTWNYKTYGGTPDCPVHVNTTDTRTFVDYNTDASTIAAGNVIIHHDGYILNGADKVASDTDVWTEYTIPLEYRDMTTSPTHIIISCAASQYGDYFTGNSNSKLWIDAVELIY